MAKKMSAAFAASSLILLASVSAGEAAQLNITCASNVSLLAPPFAVTLPGGAALCNNANMTAVETAVNDTDSRLTIAEGVITTQQGEIDDLVTLTDTHTTQIDGLVTTTDTHTTQIGDLQTITADHGSRITANEGQLANHEGRISALESDFALLMGGVGNLRQEMNEGLAISNAMEVFLPDPGSNFRLNVGMGYFGGTSAFGVTGAGRINDQGTALYFGMAGVPGSSSSVGAKAGISFQW